MGLDPAHRTPRRFRLADPFHFVILSEAKNLLLACTTADSSRVLAANRGCERFGMTMQIVITGEREAAVC